MANAVRAAHVVMARSPDRLSQASAPLAVATVGGVAIARKTNRISMRTLLHLINPALREVSERTQRRQGLGLDTLIGAK